MQKILDAKRKHCENTVHSNWGGVNPKNGAIGNGEDCGKTYSGTTWNENTLCL